MRLKIEFQDKNHNIISIHHIECKGLTHTYFAALRYSEKIKGYYPEVWFYYVTKEK